MLPATARPTQKTQKKQKSTKSKPSPATAHLVQTAPNSLFTHPSDQLHLPPPAASWTGCTSAW